MTDDDLTPLQPKTPLHCRICYYLACIVLNPPIALIALLLADTEWSMWWSWGGHNKEQKKILKKWGVRK